MNKLTHFVTLLDIYSSPYTMKINGQTKFKTKSGGLLSLFTIILLIYSLFQNGKEFLERKNPSISSEEAINYSTEEMYLATYSNKHTYIIISVEVLDADKIMAYLLINKMVIFPTECSDEVLQFTNVVKRFNNKYLCIPILPNLFFIKHILDQNPESLSNILKITVCNQYISSKESEEIDKVLENYPFRCDKKLRTISKISVTFPKIFFNKHLYDDPLQEINVEHELNLYLSYMLNDAKFLAIFETATMYDDKGWFSSDIKIYEKFSFRELIHDTSTLDKNEDYGVSDANKGKISIKLKSSSKIKKYFRNFVKVQTFAAIIGGFMKIVMLSVQTFNNFFKTYFIDMFFILNSFKFYESFEDISNKKRQNNYNHIYNYIAKRSNIDKENSTFLNYSSNQINKNLDIIDNFSKKPIIELDSSFKAKQQYKPRKNINLTLNRKHTDDQNYKNKRNWFPIYLKTQYNIICKNKVKLKGKVTNEDMYKFQTAAEVCNITRGVDYLHNKFFELELIKTFLLNDNQILAMSMVEKPYLNKNNNDHSASLLKNYKNLLKPDEDKEQEIIMYFSDLLKWTSETSNDISTIDLELMNSLSEVTRKKINNRFIEIYSLEDNNKESEYSSSYKSSSVCSSLSNTIRKI